MDIILQQGTGKYLPLLECSRPTVEAYARANGWEYRAITTPSEKPPWKVAGLGKPGWFDNAWSTREKFVLPLSAMDGSGKLVMFGDADLLFLESEDIRPELNGADFSAVMNNGGEFNLGLYVFHDTPKVLAAIQRFMCSLDAVLTQMGTQIGEQRAFNISLPSLGLKTNRLNRRWNNYRNASGVLKGKTVVCGFHDLEKKPQDKLRLMEGLLKSRAMVTR